MSGAALNYPIITLLNWGQDFGSDPSSSNGGAHSAISGVVEYLKGYGTDRDDDLVLLVDGFNVWFQLRPGVLIERYFDINRLANARIESRLGKEVVEKEHIQQSIVYSAQKRCSSREASDPACYAVPESTLPKEIYGPQTDKDVAGVNSDIKYRPRYLNNGIAMGRLGDMRKLYTRAQKLLDENKNVGSDQNILSQIFGEQEFQREALRARNLASSQRKWQKFRGEPSILDPKPDHRMMVAAPNTTYEFGIGLDYESLLGHATGVTEYDSGWIRFNNSQEIAKARNDLNITTRQQYTLPEDIARSPEPFWSGNGKKDAFDEEGSSWGNIPLYTNLYTSHVPAIIHHPIPTNPTEPKMLHKHRKNQWTQMWYFQSLWKMLDVYINEPYRPFAVVRDEEEEIAYWAQHGNKWDTRTDKQDNEWVKWEDMCGESTEEIFGQGKARGVGPWKPPRYDY